MRLDGAGRAKLSVDAFSHAREYARHGIRAQGGVLLHKPRHLKYFG